MDRNRALDILRRHRTTLELRGIAHASIFGSVARGEAKADSDVDVFLTPAEGARLGLFALGGIQSVLEEAFGVAVDMVVSPVRKPFLLSAIQQDRADAF